MVQFDSEIYDAQTTEPRRATPSATSTVFYFIYTLDGTEVATDTVRLFELPAGWLVTSGVVFTTSTGVTDLDIGLENVDPDGYIDAMGDDTGAAIPTGTNAIMVKPQTSNQAVLATLNVGTPAANGTIEGWLVAVKQSGD